MIYFWLHWVVVAACGLSLVVAKRGYFSAVVASLVAEHGLKSVGSVVVDVGVAAFGRHRDGLINKGGAVIAVHRHRSFDGAQGIEQHKGHNKDDGNCRCARKSLGTRAAHPLSRQHPD